LGNDRRSKIAAVSMTAVETKSSRLSIRLQLKVSARLHLFVVAKVLLHSHLSVVYTTSGDGGPAELERQLGLKEGGEASTHRRLLADNKTAREYGVVCL